jgi:hypothetical protein
MKISITAFLSELVAIDFETAQKVKALGCPECKSTLHNSNFTRKFRGLEIVTPPQFEVRFSFCCSSDGCRRRLTPPSVRFTRNKVYLGMVILLISSGITTFLDQTLKVSPQTRRRWMKFWSLVLSPSNPLFMAVKAFLPVDLEIHCDPKPILEFFLGQTSCAVTQGIQSALQFFRRFDPHYLRVT